MCNGFILTLFPLILFYSFTTKLCRNPSEFQALIPDYNSSVHKIQTKDGYNLISFRILPKNYSKNLKENIPVVFLMHGLGDSSDSFAISPDSLVFYFLEKGYEVWLGNNRGTKYSCSHISLKNNSKKFWDYS